MAEEDEDVPNEEEAEHEEIAEDGDAEADGEVEEAAEEEACGEEAAGEEEEWKDEDDACQDEEEVAEEANEEAGDEDEANEEAGDEDEEILYKPIERLPHSEKYCVRMRQKLRTPRLAEQFCTALIECIEKEKSKEKVAIFEDFDISQNHIPKEQFSDLFSTLADSSVQIERFRCFGVPTLNDEVASLLAGWLSAVTAETVPAEMHLSDCAMTAEGFQQISQALEENDAFPGLDPKHPHKGKLPLYLRVEHNYIDTALIQRKIDDGIAMSMRKTDYLRYSDTIKFRVMMMGSSYQQHSGDPPAPEDAPPPKRVKGKGGDSWKGSGKGRDNWTEKGKSTADKSRDRDSWKGESSRYSDRGSRGDSWKTDSWKSAGSVRDSGKSSSKGTSKGSSKSSSRANDRYSGGHSGSSYSGSSSTARGSSRSEVPPWAALPAPRTRPAVGPPPARQADRSWGQYDSSDKRGAYSGSGSHGGGGSYGGRDYGGGGYDKDRSSSQGGAKENRSSSYGSYGGKGSRGNEGPYNAFARGNASRESGKAAPSSKAPLASSRQPTKRVADDRDEALAKRQRIGQTGDSSGSRQAPKSRHEGKGSAEKLPYPWEAHWSDEYNLTYYWNSKTGESSWEKPKASVR